MGAGFEVSPLWECYFIIFGCEVGLSSEILSFFLEVTAESSHLRLSSERGVCS